MMSVFRDAILVLNHWPFVEYIRVIVGVRINDRAKTRAFAATQTVIFTVRMRLFVS